MDTNCPQCHKESIVQGKIYNQADYVDPKAYFRPIGLPFFAFFGTNIWVENFFFACSFCGHVWAKLDAAKLAEVMAKTASRHGKGPGADGVYDLGTEEK
ncbi:MAG: hypothetical protein ABH865_05780 [Candidatus Omnitrophota bacterium]